MDKQYTLEKIITNILLAITRCSVLTFSDHFTAINLTFFEKIGNFMVYSILMLMLQQYATLNKECTKYVTFDKQPLLTSTYYFQ